jgi:hypothetical protein
MAITEITRQFSVPCPYFKEDCKTSEPRSNNNRCRSNNCRAGVSTSAVQELAMAERTTIVTEVSQVAEAAGNDGVSGATRHTYDTSIEPALEPVQLFECIGKGGFDAGGRLAVQPLGLDESGTSGRMAEGAFKVPSGLGVVVRALPTGSVTAGNRQPSESESFMITSGLARTK